jgi:uncharacterized repeat protein (TIGR03803 family)
MPNKAHSLSLPAMTCVVFLFCAAAVIAAPAQSIFFTTLASFDGPDGVIPYSSLIQGNSGNFYGTTYDGGLHSYGVIFEMTPAGTVHVLYSFCSQTNCGDGIWPIAALVQASDGNFYGTASQGGLSDCFGYAGCGTIFKLTRSGRLTTLHSFTGASDGYDLTAGLVQANDGNFYGTTDLGGSNNCNYGCGTIFKITPSGVLTTLHHFDGSDGEYPFAGLVQATDGNFYGTTGSGGAYGDGTAFKITPTGTLTTLHSFDGTDGAAPNSQLVHATDGNFYGTTSNGGANGCFGSGCGTIFKITSTGVLTTLHSFDLSDGIYPNQLVQGRDGNLYGTTYGGGAQGEGTVFKITLAGALTTLYSFCTQPNCTDGLGPEAGLVQATDGNFYGTTTVGGAYCLPGGCGTVFRVGLVHTCATCRP